MKLSAQSSPSTRLCFLVSLSIFLMAAERAASYPFSDTFEAGLANWQTNGFWGLTTVMAKSPTHSACESPASFYRNNEDSSLTLASGVNLSSALRPALSFHRSYALETGWDVLRVEVSTNAGASWALLPGAVYTGTDRAWARDQFDLDAYKGKTDVRVRFRLVTDASITMDGWYVDDVNLAERPVPVTLTAVTSTPNTVSLRWTASAAPDFAAYRIYRSLATNADWHTAVEVAATTSVSVTNWTDIALAPKSTYYYRVMTESTRSVHALGNEIAVVTPAGMDYPFLDDGEAGPAVWLAEAPWALTTESADSPTHSWSDSPGGDYGPSVNASMTLAAPLNMQGARDPVLFFNQKTAFLPNDYGYVEASTNGGMAWTVLYAVPSGSSDWSRVRISLAAFTNSTQLLTRFRLSTDTSGNADGWHLDDITICESPSVVQAPRVTDAKPHSLRLDWTATDDTAFAGYAIVRGSQGAVDLNGTLVALISDRSITNYVDTGLAMDATYYYRVYAVNPHGAYSAASMLAGMNRTIIHPLPFSDGFEGSLEQWTLTGSWGAETNQPYAGLKCVGDSPESVYSNSLSAANNGLQTSVSLAGTDVPVLRFRDRFKLAAGDYGFLEVSPDGGTWYRLYCAQGGQTDWGEHEVCLMQWKGQANLRIRFYLSTDGSGTDEGWALDDVRIENSAAASLSLPFHEEFEGGMGNWVESNVWATVTNGSYSGARCLNDRLDRFGVGTEHRLTLAGKFNLADTVNPVLVFWYRGAFEWYTWFGLEVSTDGGASWGTPWALDSNSGLTVPNWTRVQVSLLGYRVPDVRLRFRSYSGGNPGMDLFVDKLTVEESPDPVRMNPLVPHLKTMEVSWTASDLGGGAFQRYEVYRSPDGTVNQADRLVGVFTNTGTVSMTDSNLSIGSTYYYGVYVVAASDSYTLSSNVVFAATVPAPGIGFTDPMETLGFWDTTGSWGVETENPYSGAACLADSPGAQYANGLHAANNGLQTSVSLAGTDVPVLRFRDRFKLAAGDYGFLEVSPDGGTWYRLYCAQGGQVDWSEHEVCLMQWKGQANLRIRFYLSTDGAGTDEGWALDDVRIENSAAPSMAIPFLDGFEAGVQTHWVESHTWEAVTNSPRSGLRLLHSMPAKIGFSTEQRLTLTGKFNLAATTNPALTFWYRGAFEWYTWFGVEVSTDGGASWGVLWALDSNSGPSVPNWTKVSVSLVPYRSSPDVRFRFKVSSSGNPAMDFAIDAVGIGDGAPGAPAICLPVGGDNVNVLRPTLWVTNAPDGENDALTYRFEVYDDAGLVTPVAQVPEVAEGSILTGWTIDLDLQDMSQYWWRCRARDASRTGTWSQVGTFHVNLMNIAPTAPVVAAPMPGSILETRAEHLAWQPASDTNSGDQVAFYHVQIDTNRLFSSPFVSDSTVPVGSVVPGTNWIVAVPLQSLVGAASLQPNLHYYWRVRAGDTRGAWSDWSSDLAWFYFGIPAPSIQGSQVGAGLMTLDFERTSRPVYVEFTTNLFEGTWDRIGGPYVGTNATVSLPTNSPTVYFRVTTE